MNNRWSLEEKNLIAEVWVEVSQDVAKDERSFWNQVVERFNNQSDGDHRNKNMVTSKWARLSSECQKFNDIYKHLQRTNHENDNDHLQNAKNIFEERFGERSFKYVHVWFILRNHPRWDE
jgi:hypothetical protein